MHPSNSTPIGSVLVVDDTPGNLKLLTQLLMRSDFVVRAARSGEMALMAVEANPPDLILLDINMPEMTGYEVCERLKANPKTESIPVIFISALNATEDIVKAFEVGGVDYISKPFKAKEVIARVSTQVSLAQQRKQIEALLERDRQRFAMVDAMRKQFIGAATHDLKNPLSHIQGYAWLLSEDEHVAADEQTRSFVATILRSVDRMNVLIEDMLDLLSIGANNEEQPDPISINGIVEQAVEDFQAQAEEKQIQLRYAALRPDPSILNIDPVRLARIMDNLVSNAIKYTPKGGSVEVTLDENSSSVILTVQDTGYGIDEAHLSQIFGTFYRIRNDQTQGIEGTGLGLSIVKAMVEQYGGQISVESKPGEGTSFRVELPLKNRMAESSSEASDEHS